MLRATWAELCEHGYGALTIDAVSQRAGTSRTVVYRRWATKAELVEAAIVHIGRSGQMETPDTGSVREDMLAVLRHANEKRLGLSALMVVFMGGYFQETGTTPADLRRLVVGERASVLEEILEHAVARGEVAASLSPRVLNVAFDLMRHDALMTLGPLADEDLVEIVDEVFLPLVLREVPR